MAAGGARSWRVPPLWDGVGLSLPLLNVLVLSSAGVRTGRQQVGETAKEEVLRRSVCCVDNP